jgi:hypothetical protein
MGYCGAAVLLYSSLVLDVVLNQAYMRGVSWFYTTMLQEYR